MYYSAACSLDTSFENGDSLQVGLDPARLYFFDEASGLAL